MAPSCVFKLVSRWDWDLEHEHGQLPRIPSLGGSMLPPRAYQTMKGRLDRQHGDYSQLSPNQTRGSANCASRPRSPPLTDNGTAQHCPHSLRSSRVSGRTKTQRGRHNTRCGKIADPAAACKLQTTPLWRPLAPVFRGGTRPRWRTPRGPKNRRGITTFKFLPSESGGQGGWVVPSPRHELAQPALPPAHCAPKRARCLNGRRVLHSTHGTHLGRTGVEKGAFDLLCVHASRGRLSLLVVVLDC